MLLPAASSARPCYSCTSYRPGGPTNTASRLVESYGPILADSLDRASRVPAQLLRRDNAGAIYKMPALTPKPARIIQSSISSALILCSMNIVLAMQRMQVLMRPEERRAREAIASARSRAAVLAGLRPPRPPAAKIDNSDIEYVECVACTELVPGSSCARPPDCGHFWCLVCLHRLFEDASKDETRYPPRCCGNNSFPLNSAKRFLRSDTVNDFNDFVTKSQYIPCPDSGCSGLVPRASFLNGTGICETCHQWACGKCGRDVHPGVDCVDQSLDILAQREGWKACPSCGYMIERVMGCNKMTLVALPLALNRLITVLLTIHPRCRCREQFCYLCVELYVSGRPTCSCPSPYHRLPPVDVPAIDHLNALGVRGLEEAQALQRHYDKLNRRLRYEENYRPFNQRIRREHDELHRVRRNRQHHESHTRRRVRVEDVDQRG